MFLYSPIFTRITRFTAASEFLFSKKRKKLEIFHKLYETAKGNFNLLNLKGEMFLGKKT